MLVEEKNEKTSRKKMDVSEILSSPIAWYCFWSVGIILAILLIVYGVSLGQTDMIYRAGGML